MDLATYTQQNTAVMVQSIMEHRSKRKIFLALISITTISLGIGVVYIQRNTGVTLEQVIVSSSTRINRLFASALNSADAEADADADAGDSDVNDSDADADREETRTNVDKAHSHPTPNGQCPGVLTGMTAGHWKTRPLTTQENKEMLDFLFGVHSRFELPASYQRNDGLCGNVTFLSSKYHRALCDPKGATTCCFNNKCASKSAEECVCDQCYDMRNMKHAEYSTWIPSHPGCTYHEHTPQEACDILDGMNIAFVGDSLVRHVYTAMLLVVTGNMKDGAMKPETTAESRMMCRGMSMFTEKLCRMELRQHLNACNERVSLSNYDYYNVSFSGKFYNLTKSNVTFIFTSVGIHDEFNYTVVENTFLKPIFSKMEQGYQKVPRVLWAGYPAPGILKSPIFSSQIAGKVKTFNKEIGNYLKKWNVPIFDTYGMTEGMMSFDGTHYGLGMNVVKANLILSYIKEQREKHLL